MTDLPTKLRHVAVKLCVPGETKLSELLLAAAIELERLQAELDRHTLKKSA